MTKITFTSCFKCLKYSMFVFCLIAWVSVEYFIYIVHVLLSIYINIRISKTLYLKRLFIDIFHWNEEFVQRYVPLRKCTLDYLKF
ncbi:unnamed protein product [Schistosoma mattheei]|uniref:Uncharacterized protein n=1 Tax=Schistosoma mattheei TaxID=31246 RepID=A0A183PFB3_9TREM|nr:unnamed protein product [Schistosoma mattheei]